MLRNGHPLTEGRIFDPTVQNLSPSRHSIIHTPPYVPLISMLRDRYDRTTTGMVCVLLRLRVDKKKSGRNVEIGGSGGAGGGGLRGRIDIDMTIDIRAPYA